MTRRRPERLLLALLSASLLIPYGPPASPVRAIDGGPIQYTYDANGRLSGVIDPVAGSAGYVYDALGNVTSIVRKPINEVRVLEVTPDRAPVGSDVTIEGTSFSQTAGQNTVRFNGTTASVDQASSTTLRVTIPAGATSGSISVTSPSGTAISPAAFVIGSSAPTITSVSPALAAVGDTITINGTNFDVDEQRDAVAFTGIRARLTDATVTAIHATLPPSGSGLVTIATDGGATASPGYLFVVPPGRTAADIHSTGVVTVGTGQNLTIPVTKFALRAFEASAGQHLAVTMPGLGSTVGIHVYRPDGSQLAALDSGPAVFDFVIPTTGTYTAEVRAGGNPSTGSLLISPVASEVTGTIAVGGPPVVVTTTAPGQNGRLTFQATAGQRVAIGGQSNGSWYSKLSLLSPDGVPLVFNNAATIHPALAPVTLPETGTYTILVDPAADQAGQLTLTLSPDGDATGTIAPNQTISIPTFVSGQNVAVTFAGSAGQRVSVRTIQNNWSSTTSLRDPGGATLASLTSWGAFLEPTVLPVTGTYTIYIDPYQGMVGSGTLSLWDVPADITGTIAIGGPTVNVPMVPGQEASLTFDGTSGQTISLTTFNGDAPNISISQPGGGYILGPTGSVQQPFPAPVVLPVDGTYTIGIDPSGANQGNYALTLYAVPPDDTGTMTIGGPASVAANTAPGQNMSRTFSGTLGQVVSFDASQVSVAYSRALTATVRVLKPDGSILWGPAQIWQPSTGTFMEPMSLPATGTYTIAIDPNLEAVVSYSLALYAVPADETGTITVGGPAVVATASIPGQNMRRTFACTSGQKVKLVVTNSTFSWVDVQILHAGGGWATGSGFGPPGATLTATLSGSGTCTIFMDPAGNANGSMTLTLTNSPTGAPAPLTESPAVADESPMPVGEPEGVQESAPPASPITEPGPPPVPPDGPAESPPASEFPLAEGPTDQGLDAPDAGEPEALAEDGADRWRPNAANRRGDWRAQRPRSSWEDVPLRTSKPGDTALAGRVLSLDGSPLRGVSVELHGLTAVTDARGRFLLRRVPPGPGELHVDGSTANRPEHVYGSYEIGVDVTLGMTTKLPYTIWMTALDTENASEIPETMPAEVVVTTPDIPGLELHLPRGSRVVDEHGDPVTEVSITAIPIDRPPFPLPANTEVPIYFTIQPGGAYIEPYGAYLVYPNYTDLAPGTRTNFWQYDPETGGWFVYGFGTVTDDGTQVVPDRRVRLYEFTGAMFGTGEFPPDDGPPAEGDSDDGDPVDLATGLFVLSKVDLIEPGVLPIALGRTYRPGDSAGRAFGIGTNWSYGFFLWSASYSGGSGPYYTEVDLVLPDGGRVHFVRTSEGTSWLNAVFRSTASPGPYFGSSVYWNGTGWDLRLRDGTVYEFGDNAPLRSITDRYGNRIELTRTGVSTGPVTRIQSSSGRWIELTYDGANRISTATDQSDRTVTYTYNSAGYLWKVTDPDGGVTEYTYDAANRMRTVKDARGITFLTNEYDANGRVELQTMADGATFEFAYSVDGAGNVVQTDVTGPLGEERRVTFNTAGYALSDTRALGEPEEQTITYVRQSSGNLPTSVTDELGRRTDYTYDGPGNVLAVTRLAGTPDAVTTEMTYDQSFRQLASVTDALDHTTTFEYDARGNVETITDARDKQTLFTSNGAGQPTSVTDATGKTTSWTYRFGDLVAVTDPLGNLTQSFVDSAGRSAATTSPLGAQRRTLFDPLNRPTAIIDPLGGSTDFTYDRNGSVLTVTDANDGQTTSTYDEMDRLETREDPLERAESFAYDLAGNLLTATDRSGQVTELRYDPLGRREFVGFGAVEVGGVTIYESTVTSAYDDGNRLHTLLDSSAGTTTYDYDGLDRLTSEASPQGIVSYAYDDAGRRTRMTLAGQPDVSYIYDDANRVMSVTQGSEVVGLTYDDAGRRLTMTRPGSLVSSYAYDDASHLTSITYADGAAIGDLVYTYNADGRVSVVDGSLSGTVLPASLPNATYDAANQLQTWGTASLDYDANGNLIEITPATTTDGQAPTVPSGQIATAAGPGRINLSWTASSDNQGVTSYIVRRGGTALTSVAGSVTSFTDWSAAPSTSYSYTVSAADAAGNASAQSGPANATTPSAVTTYASDAFNRTLSGSWGTADTGGSWSGTDSTFSVAPGWGKVTLSSATNKNANLTSVAARDTEVLIKINVNKLAAGGDTLAWVALRRQSASTYYSARVTFKTNQQIALAFVRTSNNTNTTIGSATATPTHAIADSYWLRVQISGTTATTGRMRLWRVGTTEPSTWTVNSTDNATPTALRGNGHVGIRFQKTGTGGLPVVGSFGSFTVTSLPPPPDTAAPSVPTSLTASTVSHDQVNLSWSASTDNVGVQGYRIYRDGSLLTTVGSTTWSDTGRAPSTTYSYTVAAIDGTGNASAQTSSAGASTPGAPAVTTYNWNARNQLTEIETDGIGSASFAYDAAGRRVSKTVGAASTGFAYTGPNAIQEVSGGTPTANLLTGGIDELFRRTDSVGTRYPLTDNLGSVVALVDGTGALKTTYSYGPYGQTSVAGEANANPTRFTGREDDGTGLYYYRARYYHPVFGRFISEDPIGLAAGDPNLYRYVGGDPTNATDPSGLVLDTIADVGFIAWDLWNLATGSRKDFDENLAALGLDVLGMVIPGVTGLGMAGRAARGADEVIGFADEGAAAIDNALAGRAGKPFTPRGRQEVWADNIRVNDGTPTCSNCNIEVVPPAQSQRGITPSANEGAVDHIYPQSRGGAGSPPNGQLLCRECNAAKSDHWPWP